MVINPICKALFGGVGEVFTPGLVAES